MCDGPRKGRKAPVFCARQNQGWEVLHSLEALLHPPPPNLAGSRDLQGASLSAALP